MDTSSTTPSWCKDQQETARASVLPLSSLEARSTLSTKSEVESRWRPTSTSKSDEMEKYMHSLKLCALRETSKRPGLLLLPSPSPSPSGLPTSLAVGHQEAGMSAEEWAHARNDDHHNAVDFATLPPQGVGQTRSEWEARQRRRSTARAGTDGTLL